MPSHNFRPSSGRIERLTIESRAVARNLLGDPSSRVVDVYLPDGYDDAGDDYPLLVFLAGFTGSGLKLHGWRPFDESVPQKIDRLVEAGAMGPVIAAFPDCFTSLGGNQYVNSVALGNWDDFLHDEMIPRLENEFRLRKGAEHRAVLGKSSGGYGALVQGLLHGDRWEAIACHSGDMGFDWVYRPDFPVLLDQLDVTGDGGDL
jgi:enterochelin esterase-like enzyme